MRRRALPQEPLTITSGVIAETLERLGYCNMAAHVRYMGQRVGDANVREDALRADYARVVERLHQYEPPTSVRTPNYQPPPEASD